MVIGSTHTLTVKVAPVAEASGTEDVAKAIMEAEEGMEKEQTPMLVLHVTATSAMTLDT